MMLFERLYKWLGKYVNCPLSLCNVKHFPFAYFLHIFTIKIRPYTQPGLSEKIQVHDDNDDDHDDHHHGNGDDNDKEDVDHLLFFFVFF